MIHRWTCLLLFASATWLGAYTASYDYDVYTCTGFAGPGQTIDATLTLGPSADWDLMLYTPGATLVAQSSNGAGVGEQVSYAIPEGGEFGSYGLYIVRRSGSGACTLETSVSGETPPNPMEGFQGLWPTYESRVYYAAVAPGQAVAMDARSYSLSVMPLMLTSPSGVVVANSDPGATYRNAMAYTVPEGGEQGVYRIDVGYLSGTLGCSVHIDAPEARLDAYAGTYPTSAGFCVTVASGESFVAEVDMSGISGIEMILCQTNGAWLADAFPGEVDRACLSYTHPADWAPSACVLVLHQWSGPAGYTLHPPVPVTEEPTSATRAEWTFAGPGDGFGTAFATIEEGQTIELSASGEGAWAVDLCSPSWAWIGSIDSWSETPLPLAFTVPCGGERGFYRVNVRRYCQTGELHVRAVVTGDAPAGSLSSAATNAMTAQVTGRRSFVVEMGPGQSLTAAIAGTWPAWGWVELFSPSGAFLGHADSMMPEGSFSYTVPEWGEEGAYTVQAAGEQESVRVDLSVTSAPPLPQGIASASGSGTSIEAEWNRQTWTFEMAPGQRLLARIDAVRTAGWQMSLWGPGGVWPSSGDTVTNGRIDYTVPSGGAAGRYYVEVCMQEGAGAWAFQGTVVDPAQTAIPLEVGQTLEAQAFEWSYSHVDPLEGHEAEYRLSLVAGHTYVMETFDNVGGTTDDTVLYLFDGTGELVAWDNDSNGNRASRIEYTADRTGDFSLKLRSYWQGEFGTCSLRLTEATDSGSPP